MADTIVLDSILTTVKKALGNAEDDTTFDTDIIMHINSVLAILSQLGVGPNTGFSISDKTAVWSDFIANSYKLSFVKSYVFLKVKLLFDPPLSSAVIDSMKQMISELEWRIQVEADTEASTTI